MAPRLRVSLRSFLARTPELPCHSRPRHGREAPLPRTTLCAGAWTSFWTDTSTDAVCGGIWMSTEGQRAPAAGGERPLPGGDAVLVALEDGIAWVTLNRPEKRNAISPALAAEMLTVIDALE